MPNIDLNLILLPTVVFVFLAVAFFGFLIFSASLKKKGKISRSLNMGLLEISLPVSSEKEEKEGQHKEEIGKMEQVFSSLANFKESGLNRLFYPKPYLVFEMTSTKESQEVSFFISAPRKYLEIVKKVIYGFYPDAQINETKDYNIFNESGATAGSFLTLEKNYALPITTYKELQADPIREIINTLTKLQENTEGASFQLVFSPATAGWTSKPNKILQEMEKGKSFDAARSEVYKNKLFGFLGSLQKNTQKPDNNLQYQPPIISLSDRKITESIQQKISKPGFSCNLRLLASAQTPDQAQQILAQIESAFVQFASPQLNGFKINRPSKRLINRLIYDFSFRFLNQKHQFILNSEELSSIFHFSVAGGKSPRLKSLKSKTAPPPPSLPKEGIVLGKNNYRGIETLIRASLDDRRRHFYTVGQTGTGKTYFIQEMVRQDIEGGQGLAVIDPHGDLVNQLLGLIPQNRLKDVIYFNPGDLKHPLGLNMLEYDPEYPEQKTFIINEMVNIFDKLYDLKQTGGPMFEQYMRNALLLLMDDSNDQATLMDVPRVFNDREFRDRLLGKAKNQIVIDFWQKEAEKAGGEAALQNITPYVTSKFNTFVANDYMRPIISQPKSAFNFREAMDQGKIILVNLSKGRLGDINSNLLGMILVGKITMAALSRVDISQDERRDFFLYIDEFQNVTTDSIGVILSEARKYHLNLVIAHQYIKQIQEKNRDAVFGNVGSMCVFRVGAEDAEILVKHFEPVFSASDLMGLDNRKAYLKLLIGGNTTAPFNIETLEAKKPNLQLAEKIKEYSALKYGQLDA